MLACEEDFDRLAEAARQALRILNAEPLKRVISQIDFPLRADADRDEWRRYLRQAAFRANHPAGTCRMGPDDDAVVDPRLRVRGVDGLRVVDASIIPVIPRANTNAPVLMIAEKAAAMIREDRRSEQFPGHAHSKHAPRPCRSHHKTDTFRQEETQQ
jgi:choline dehydrogenase